MRNASQYDLLANNPLWQWSPWKSKLFLRFMLASDSAFILGTKKQLANVIWLDVYTSGLFIYLFFNHAAPPLKFSGTLQERRTSHFENLCSSLPVKLLQMARAGWSSIFPSLFPDSPQCVSLGVVAFISGEQVCWGKGRKVSIPHRRGMSSYPSRL